MHRANIVLACLVATCGISLAQTTRPALPATRAVTPVLDPLYEQTRAAAELQQQNRPEDAVRAYLALRGGEAHAARIVAKDPARYRPLLEATAKGDEPARSAATLLLADQLLAAGDGDGALAAYRRVAAVYAANREGYPVDLDLGVPTDRRPIFPSLPIVSFQYGAGAHNDNWLVRRFITLKATQDAATELARVWAIHQSAASDGRQLSGIALRFALDYAIFQQQQLGQNDAALDLLGSVLEQIDLERPGTIFHGNTFIRPIVTTPAISRVEFIRIAFGIFKQAGAEDRFIAIPERQVRDGRLSAARTLAAIRKHQGRTDAALQLELNFIRDARFNAITTAYRRGLIFEAFARPADALPEFEKCLALPYEPVKFPVDTEDADIRSIGMAVAFSSVPGTGEPAFRAVVRARLLPICTSLGKTDRVLELKLQDLHDALLQPHGIPQVEPTARAFAAAGKSAEFATWARDAATKAANPRVRADLLWCAGDKEQAVDAIVPVAAAATDSDKYLVDFWANRLKDEPSLQRKLLLASARGAAGNSFAALKLLDLDPFSPDAPAILEQLLREDASWPFGVTQGSHNPTQFVDYFDLAYRLARVYEKSANWPKLQELALRVARRSKPFAADRNLYRVLKDQNAEEEYANALLAMAIEHRDRLPDRAAVEDAIRQSSWVPARRQLERVSARTFGEPVQSDFPWKGLPQGVTLIASNETVLNLVRDNTYVYAGHPWGISVYDLSGKPVTRIPLARAAMHMAIAGDALWVGTPDGIFRITPKDLSVTYLPCDDDLDAIGRRNAEWSQTARRVDWMRAEEDTIYFTVRDKARALDPRTLELRYVARRQWPYTPPVPLPPELHKPLSDAFVAGKVACDSPADAHPASGPMGAAWRRLQLPDGSHLFCTYGGPRVRYEYSSEDWPYGPMVQETSGDLGIYHMSADGAVRHISSVGRHSVAGMNAFFALPEPGAQRVWVGSEAGLTLFDADFRLIRILRRHDGLCSNRVTSGAAAGGKLYFATATDDHAGGMIVIDPATTLITSLFRADGMATDKMATITADGNTLTLGFAPEYMRSRSDRGPCIWYPPQTFDVQTGVFSPAGQPERLQESAINPRLNPEKKEWAPYLGGHVLRRQIINGKQVILSTRGIIILAPDAPAEPAPTPMQVTTAADPVARQVASARQLGDVSRIPPERLEQIIKDNNPFAISLAIQFLANAAADNPAYVPLIAGCAQHPELRVRAAVVYTLNKSTDPAAIAALEKMMADENLEIRRAAAVGLANRGRLQKLDLYEEMLKGGPTPRWGTFVPIGIDSQVVLWYREQVWQTLGAHAGKEGVVPLFLRYPPPPFRSGPFDPISSFAKSLAAEPQIAATLFQARDHAREGRATDFVVAVCHAAGKPVLPEAHKALASADRVIRSNAARACGAIGDPSSIPLLIKALDLESGLSRASIVWALGELRAAEAIPEFQKLYLDLAREAGAAGQLAAQVQSQATSSYNSLPSSPNARPEGQYNDILLSRELILQATGRMDPDKAAPFLLSISGTRDIHARRSAAEYLGGVSPAFRDRAIETLKALAADTTDNHAAAAAAVSLIRLDDPAGQTAILSLLDDKAVNDRHFALTALNRLPDRQKITFAIPKLQSIAADPNASEHTRTWIADLLKTIPPNTPAANGGAPPAK